MPRIKNAAEKQYDPTTPAQNAMGIIFGTFMSSQFLTAILAAANLTPDGPTKLRNAAASEQDEQKKKTLLEIAALQEEEIANLTATLGTEGAKAIMTRNAKFFREIAELVETFGEGSGSVADRTRQRLISKHPTLLRDLGRNPTASELKQSDDTFSKMDHAQFTRLCQEQGLDFTPARLLKGIQIRAKRLRRKTTRIKVEDLRAALADLDSASEICKLPAAHFTRFCESAGVVFG